MASEILMRQLEYLVALSREQHFGRAAEACFVTQPALSAALRKLETELDVTIIQRGQRFEGFTLEGQRVVGWAHRILAERDALTTDLARLREGLSATLRLGAIPTAASATPLISGRFRERHPHARVRVEVLPSREIVRRITEFELDAGLTYLDEDTPAGFHQVELYREQYLLLTPEHSLLAHNDIVGWREAAALPLCALVPSMKNRRILDATMAATGGRHDPVVETDTIGALYAHLAGGGLSSVVSHAWLHALGVPHGMVVVPMEPQREAPAVGLVLPPHEPSSIVADELLAAIAGLDVAKVLEASLSRFRPG